MKVLQVTAKRPSFWRGGIEFGHAPKFVPVSELSADQIKAIENEGKPDGMLIVNRMDVKDEKPPKDEKPAA